MGKCTNCDPETDETAINCNGEFLSEDCIVLKPNSYLGILSGDYLSKLILKITSKFKSLDQKFNTTLNLVGLPVFENDAAAGMGGLTAGKAYRTSTGQLMVKL